MGIPINSHLARVALSAASFSFFFLPSNFAATDTPEPIKYIGPGSCAATSCHGSVKPVAGSRILQNEYSTWIISDKHSRAYQVLTEPLGVRIGKILKLKEESKDAPKCLVCHALYTAPEQRARA